MTMESLLELLQAALLLVSIFGGTVAVITYRRDSSRRRAQWLQSFYEKFFEKPEYKKIRFILDYQPPEYEEIRAVLESDAADERAEDVVDYLNFFEFMASLWRLGQISFEDICMLFDYYLRNLNSHDWLRKFVHEQGFESLDQLLGEIERRDCK